MRKLLKSVVASAQKLGLFFLSAVLDRDPPLYDRSGDPPRPILALHLPSALAVVFALVAVVTGSRWMSCAAVGCAALVSLERVVVPWASRPPPDPK